MVHRDHTTNNRMDKNTLSRQLRALATDDLKRSKAARLRDVLDDVEMALAAGAKRADVLATLNEHGLDMSLTTFETTLKRLRAKRGKTGIPTLAEKQDDNIQTPTSTIEEKHQASHNPADLDQIINSKPDLGALARAAKGRKK